MIQKDKFYLCVGTFYKKDPFNMDEGEDLTHATDNSFVNVYYNGEYYARPRISFSWTAGNMYYDNGFYRPDPVFRKGILYHCYEDGYLFDDCGQRVNVMPYNYENFIDIDFKIDDTTQSRIDVLKNRNLKVDVIPVSQLKEGVQPNDPVTLDNVAFKYQATMGYKLKVGFGSGNTQLEAVNDAWKKLRVKSDLVRKLSNCIGNRCWYWGAYKKPYSYYNTL
jgi:hypothetical protein